MARAAFPLSPLAVLALAMSLSACGEKPQTAGGRIDADGKAWQGAQPGFTAPGWKAGDQAAWQEQIRQRNLKQNEYLRMTP